MSAPHGLLLWAAITTAMGSAQSSIAPSCLGEASPGFLSRIRLDTARSAFLLETIESHVSSLYSIRYSANSECPTILDSVKGSEASTSFITVFEYECSVVGHKGEAAVALTRIDKDGRRLGILKTWLIDPHSLHFIATKGKSTCSDKGYAGEDAGGDIFSRARGR